MKLLDPALQQKLARARLQVRWAVAERGIGERRSARKGAGIEFADHRPYQLGDDLRYLDRFAFARLGQHYIKQYALYQQLPITILLDASASMDFGRPRKIHFGAALTAALAYVGLAGADSVLVGTVAEGRISWFRRLHGVQRTPELFRWLEQVRPRGHTGMPQALRGAVQKLSPSGLVILISDWLGDGNGEALATLAAARQEIMAVQLLAPEELEPERLGTGDVRFVDAEDLGDVEISLDWSIFERYGQELERLSQTLAEQVQHQEGRFFRVRSDDNLERLLLRDWRGAGVLS